MIRIVFIVVTSAIILASCSDGIVKTDKTGLLDSIQKMEAELYSSVEVSLTSDKANSAVLLYSRYVHEFPGDSICPIYIFKSAEMFRAVNNGKMAIDYYKRLVNEYPESEKVPVAIFLQGFVYENILNDMTNARNYYQMYLDKYPQGEFAKDANVLIMNLGKSPEEMIKEFEQQNDTLKAI